MADEMAVMLMHGAHQVRGRVVGHVVRVVVVPTW